MAGIFAVVCAFACFIFALTGASSAGWFSAHTLGLLAAAAVRGGVLFPLQRYAGAAHPGAGVPLCSVHAEYAGHCVCADDLLGHRLLIRNYAQLVLHQNAFCSGLSVAAGLYCGRGGLTVQRSIAGSFRRKAPHSNRKPGNSVCSGVFRRLYPCS